MVIRLIHSSWIMVLMGLQALHGDAKIRGRIFEILQKRVRPGVSHLHGRPGMDLWRIFVLGVVKQALNCDFDRLHELANNHLSLRQMLVRQANWRNVAGASPVV